MTLDVDCATGYTVHRRWNNLRAIEIIDPRGLDRISRAAYPRPLLLLFFLRIVNETRPETLHSFAKFLNNILAQACISKIAQTRTRARYTLDYRFLH